MPKSVLIYHTKICMAVRRYRYRPRRPRFGFCMDVGPGSQPDFVLGLQPGGRLSGHCAPCGVSRPPNIGDLPRRESWLLYIDHSSRRAASLLARICIVLQKHRKVLFTRMRMRSSMSLLTRTSNALGELSRGKEPPEFRTRDRVRDQPNLIRRMCRTAERHRSSLHPVYRRVTDTDSNATEAPTQQ
jgi:hypothetical protein